MSLKTDLNQAVVDIFSDFSSLLKDAVYREISSATPVAGGKVSKNETVFDVQVIMSKNDLFGDQERGFVTGAKSYDVEGDTFELLLPVKGLIFIPTTRGTMEIDQVTYKITDVSTDPSDSLYTLKVKA